ncbi:MAG: energy transducer TonB [Alphaproteobacteria bacterium]|nr:energy transducer TonB [Alphaproteobacteria bacterium]
MTPLILVSLAAAADLQVPVDLHDTHMGTVRLVSAPLPPPRTEPTRNTPCGTAIEAVAGLPPLVASSCPPEVREALEDWTFDAIAPAEGEHGVRVWVDFRLVQAEEGVWTWVPTVGGVGEPLFIEILGKHGGSARLIDAPLPDLPEEVNPEDPPRCAGSFTVGESGSSWFVGRCPAEIEAHLKHWTFDGVRPAARRGVVDFPVTIQLEQNPDGTWAWTRSFTVVQRSASAALSERVPEPPPPARPGYIEPEAKVRVRPEYPRAAQRKDMEGRCRVHMFLDERGVPYDAVVSECPEVFHEAAFESAMKWRFYPAKENGEAVRCEFDLFITFKR